MPNPDILLTVGINLEDLHKAKQRIDRELQTWKMPTVGLIDKDTTKDITGVAKAIKQVDDISKSMSARKVKIVNVGDASEVTKVTDAIKMNGDVVTENQEQLNKLSQTTAFYKSKNDLMGVSLANVKAELTSYLRAEAEGVILDDASAVRKQQLITLYAQLNKEQQGLLHGLNIQRLLLWAVGWKLVYGAMNEIMKQIGDVISSMLDLNSTISQLRIVSHETGSEFAADWDNIRQTIVKTSKDSITSIKDLNAAVKIAYFEGVKSKEAIQAITVASKDMSEIMGIKAADAARVIAQAFELFGDKLVGTKNDTEKIYKITALLMQLYTDGGITLQNFETMMSRVGITAKDALPNLESLTALLRLMDTLMKGNRVGGMELAQVLLKLSADNRGLSETFGISFKPDQVVLFTDVVEELRKVLGKTIDSAEEQQLAQVGVTGNALSAFKYLISNWDIINKKIQESIDLKYEDTAAMAKQVEESKPVIAFLNQIKGALSAGVDKAFKNRVEDFILIYQIIQKGKNFISKITSEIPIEPGTQYEKLFQKLGIGIGEAKDKTIELNIEAKKTTDAFKELQKSVIIPKLSIDIGDTKYETADLSAEAKQAAAAFREATQNTAELNTEINNIPGSLDIVNQKTKSVIDVIKSLFTKGRSLDIPIEPGSLYEKLLQKLGVNISKAKDETSKLNTEAVKTSTAFIEATQGADALNTVLEKMPGIVDIVWVKLDAVAKKLYEEAKIRNFVIPFGIQKNITLLEKQAEIDILSAGGVSEQYLNREKAYLAAQKVAFITNDLALREKIINDLIRTRNSDYQTILYTISQYTKDEKIINEYINSLISDRSGMFQQMAEEVKSLADTLQGATVDFAKNLMSGTANIKDFITSIIDSYRSAFAEQVVQMFGEKTGIFAQMASMFMSPLQKAHYSGVQSAVPLIIQAHVDGIKKGMSSAYIGGGSGAQQAQNKFGMMTGLFGNVKSALGLPGSASDINKDINAVEDIVSGTKTASGQMAAIGKAVGQVAGGIAGLYGGVQGIMAQKGQGPLQGAMGGAMSGAMGGMVFGPVGAIVGGIIGAIGGGILGGQSKTTHEIQKQTQEITSRINITNKELQIVNRNLEGIRRGFEGYIMPRSAYFSERMGVSDRFNIDSNRGYYGE